jgi:hypothetical protein
MEGGTLSWFGLHPYAAPVALHNLFANRQTNPRARIFLAPMQTLEDHEDPVKILRVDADSVIANAQLPSSLLAPGRDMNSGCFVRPPELDSIAEQILEELRQLRSVGYQ